MRPQFSRDFVQPSLALALALSGMVLALPGHAGTATDSLAVSATVAANCTITASTALAFGTYDPIVANAAGSLDTVGSVSTTCTQGSAVTVTLGEGANAAVGSTGTTPLRQMTSGSAVLPYALFSDAGYTTVWGNTTPTGLADVGDGSARKLFVYGRIAAGLNVPAGTYSDTVVATATF